MKRKNRMKIAFRGESLDDMVVLKAAKAVALMTTDKQEALLMLDMLGIVDPQPGNEIKLRRESKAELQAERRRIVAEEQAKEKEKNRKRITRNHKGHFQLEEPTSEELGEGA